MASNIYSINQPVAFTDKVTFAPPDTTGIPSTSSGSVFTIPSSAFTDNDTSTSGTLSNWAASYFASSTLAATNSTVTTTVASTLYIADAPIAGANETITNAYALNVDSGKSHFGGQVISSLSTGTAPFSVASTTNVANLNASSLSGATFGSPGSIGSGVAGTGAFTTLSATGVVTSTLATGTAPFTVASTTNVPNLNASSLSGATFASPGPVGSSVADTGAFTTFSASDPSFTGQLDMNSNKITNLATPTDPSDAVNKGYVDLSIQGLDPKDSVRATTTTAGTLATDFSNSSVIDGITLATGNRILIKDQADPIENGIYVVNASGAPTRAADFATAAQVAGSFMFVEEGTAYSDSGFVCTSDISGDTVGTDPLSFTQFSGAGQITAGTGLTKTGNTLSVNAAQTQITSVGTLSSLTTSGPITSTLVTGTAPFTIASTTNVANLNASSLSGATFASPGSIGSDSASSAAFTTISASDQITSTLADGTAPFIVASSTNVANLNASTLGGATFASPGVIGSSTPDDINATSLIIKGTTSGEISILPQAIAGTYNFNLPVTAGDAGQVLVSQGGASSVMTWADSSAGSVTSVDLTVPAFLSVTGNPVTSVGTLAVDFSGSALPIANGGTGSTSATGSGIVVLQESPTLVTPSLGAATADSLVVGMPAIISTQGAFLQWDRSGTDGETWLINQQGAGGDTSGIRFGSATTSNVVTEFARIIANGNMGIGTTAPGSSLHVAGAIPTAPSGSGVHIGQEGGNGVIQLNGTNGGYIDFSSTDVDFNGRIIYDNTGGTMTFFSGGLNAIRINVDQSLESLVTTGTAPFVVASTTNVANLNASSLSGATFGSPGAIGSGSASSGAFTTISATGAITSTLATGTAPFTVASTTNVANLNASSLSGATFASPGAIGSGSASSGAFTTVSATGAITSTLSTGTAPFTVASTTNVANLNASSLSGATFASPGSIGSGSASSGAFTTVSASDQITSTLATGTAPFVVASSTNIANLNASSLSGATFGSPGPIGSSVADTGAFTTFAASDPTFTGQLNMSSNKIINLAAPADAGDAVNKGYVDLAIQGLDTKDSVIAATTAAGILASDFADGSIIDGITLATGNRILIKNQADPIENGIYIVNASGAPTRSTDLDTGSSAAGTFTFIESGSVNNDNGFVCTDNSPADIVGTDPLVFVQFSGAGQIIAGTGLSKTGNTLNVNASQTQVTSVGTLSGLTTSGVINSTVTTGTAPLIVASTTNVANLNASTLSGATFGSPGSIGSSVASSGAFTTVSATGVITSTLATGTAPFTVASSTNVANLNASSLSGATFAAPGSIGSSSASSGAFTTVSASDQITSTLVDGTAPFVISSSTVVANLNASALGGATFAAPGSIGTGVASDATFTTVNASDQITSTLVDGTAPFVVSSSTVVANLNASALGGATFAAPGSIGSSSAGSGAFTTISASGAITSTVADGNAPLVVSSSTVVANLNASALGGATFAAPGSIGSGTASDAEFTTVSASGAISSTIADGNAPFIVASSTNVANLNASTLSGATFASPGPVGSSASSSGAFTTVSASDQITSTLADGTAPFVVNSSTVVANLNASALGGATFGSPGSIGSGTASDAEFTTVSASDQITSTLADGTAPFVVASSTVVANLNASALGGATFGSPGPVGGTVADTINATDIVLKGASSGVISILPQSTAGTYNFNLPVTAGSAGQVLVSQGGTDAMTWSDLNSTTAFSFVGANNQSSPADITDLAYSTGFFEVNVTATIIATTNLTQLFTLYGVQSGSGVWNLSSINVSGDTTSIAYSITAGGQVQYTSGNYTGFVSLTFNWSESVESLSAVNLVTGIDTTGTPDSGNFFTVNSAIFTDNATSASGTLSNWYSTYVGTPSVVASNSAVTTTNASTVFIQGAPTAGTNETISNSYALNINSGKSRFGGIIQSEVTTGTAPFIVASSTNVINLNASSLSGATFASPGSIGSSSASSGAFTTISASTSTDATSSTAGGALTITGGAAVAKKLFVGSDTFVAGKLGVGTTSPDSAFQVTGAIGASPLGTGVHLGTLSGYSVMQLNETSGSYIDFGSSGVDFNGRIIYDNTDGTMTFFSGGLNAIRLNNNQSLESLVSTGTAPFVVASTTNVANLNASTLSGATFASPGPVGSVTASTGAFTTFSASTPTFTGQLDMSSHKIINIASPSAVGDAANKGYVDLAIQGLSTKDSVIAATTVAGTLAIDFANSSVIDGVTLATGNRILIKNQTDPVENGIYVVNIVGAPTRSSDLDTGSHSAGTFTFVESGSVNNDNGFVCTDTSPSDIVGTDPLLFVQFSGAGQIIPGTGLSKSANTLSVNASQTQITAVGTLSSLTTSGPITSTLATGTAPFTIASTTNVANLNASSLSGATFASPGSIGSSSASSGAFTAVSASGVITSTLATGTAPFTIASTTNVINLNASTLSGATFASPGSIGSGSASSGAFTTVSAAATTDATSSTAGGALTVTGGAAVAKKLFVGSDTFVAGKLGVGTTSPDSALQVTGAIGASPIGAGVHLGTLSGYSVMQLNETSGGYIDFGSSGVDFNGRIIYDNVGQTMTFFSGGLNGIRLNSNQSLESLVSTGTAPFVVASTTNVANLNASTLSGATFASPGSIGSGSASTGAFTTVSASGNITCSDLIANNHANISTSTGGAFLQWNRSANDGESWVINQPGSGLANSGIRFGSSTSSNVVTEFARIIANGNMGINNTNPVYKLDVGGSMHGTSLVIDNSITSSVATGTAPFVVSSTTNVANLNASSLNGATFASPGTIGGTTPSLVNAVAYYGINTTFSAVDFYDIPIDLTTYKYVDVNISQYYSGTSAVNVGFTAGGTNLPEFTSVITKTGGTTSIDTTNVIFNTIDTSDGGLYGSCLHVRICKGILSGARTMFDIRGTYIWGSVGLSRVDAACNYVGVPSTFRLSVPSGTTMTGSYTIKYSN